MSFTTSRDHLSPQDPLYYAPPRLRRGPDFPTTPAPETDSGHWRPTPATSGFDALLEEAVAESLARPQDIEIDPESPALAFEHNGRRRMFGVATGLAGAVAAAAVVAFFVVVMIPKAQTSDPREVARSELRTLLALATAGRKDVLPEEPQTLLRKFVQWQQRDGAEQQVAR
jgi:hypothetical protein